MTYGFVYVLTNEAMPSLLKIGMTTGSPVERCNQLSSSTGVPCSFVPAFAYEVDDVQKAERDVHLALEGFRFNNKREFFATTLEKAKEMIELALYDYNSFIDYGSYGDERDYSDYIKEKRTNEVISKLSNMLRDYGVAVNQESVVDYILLRGVYGKD